MPAFSDDPNATAPKQYRAPALEKGLDILEIMADADGPLTLSVVATRLSRSMSELFRMFQVLIDRGYLAPAASGSGYELSPKLLTIARRSHALRGLITKSLPHMNALCESTQLACHLSVLAESDLIVIASAEGSGAVNFSLRPGFCVGLTTSAAGRVVFGFETVEMRSKLTSQYKAAMTEENWRQFYEDSETARAQGYSLTPSDIIPGVTDICAPVFDGLGIRGALTIPYFRHGKGLNLQHILRLLNQTANDISLEMGRNERLSLGLSSIKSADRDTRPALTLVR